ATLPAAVQKVRAIRKTHTRPEPISIFLRGGEYELQEPVVLTPEDSGTNEENVFTIAAYQNERPVLSGGRHIRAWKKVKATPGMWQASIAEVAKGQWHFHELFIDGERKQRARSPNSGYFRVHGLAFEGRPARLKL